MRLRFSHSRAITKSYRITRNVRRLFVKEWGFVKECGGAFKFDRSFIVWLKDGVEKTMGDAAEEVGAKLESGSNFLETSYKNAP